jgi:iron complex transport system ATP-binding protein
MGRNLRDYTDKELPKVIGVVLTDKADVRNMTVEDLVGLGRSPYTGFWGTLHAQDRRIVDEAMEMVGITDLRDRMIQTLSDGERQKVMIAKALAQQTPVIFLDEPTAFLDFPSKVEIMQLLRNLSRTMGKTIFMSTHDLELALQLSDTIWLMDQTNGVITGTPHKLATDGSLNRFFSQRGISFNIHNIEGHLCIVPSQ